MELASIYGFEAVTTYDEECLCVENTYTKSIVDNLNYCYQQGVIPSYVVDTLPVTLEGSNERSILDFPDTQGRGSTIGNDIVHFMQRYVQNQTGVEIPLTTATKRLLTFDYLLSTSICLVEHFDVHGLKVTKYYATRNPDLLMEFTGNYDREEKIRNSLFYSKYNYENNELPLLKLRAVSGEIKETIPRSPIKFNELTKVTPFYLIKGLLDGFNAGTNYDVYHVKYIKDDLTLRDIYVTHSIPILSKYYDNDMVQKMVMGQTPNLLRGYIRLPEFGASKYDESGVRAINLSRILSIRIVKETSVDMQYINVFFDNIVPSFKSAIDYCDNLATLKKVYHDLTQTEVPPQIAVPTLVQDLIKSIVDSKVTIGTTTALKSLHSYMMSNPHIFKGYTGEKPRNFTNNTGMMGIES